MEIVTYEPPLPEELVDELADFWLRAFGEPYEDQAGILNIIGEVHGKVAVLVDDEVDTGGTILAAITALEEAGVQEVYACCTHGLLSAGAAGRLAESNLKELILTDTLPVTDGKRNEKFTVLSVAPLLGEAIHRIHSGLSVGAMFE